MQLPHADKIKREQIVRKLEACSLNINHVRGKHKARLFRSILGITLENKEVFVEALLANVTTSEATLTKSDRYGRHYTIDFRLTTDIGSSMIRTAWIIGDDEQYPALTSTYPIKTSGEKS